MNLLHNAFKYTPRPGRVALRTRSEQGHILIEVEDGCGGFPETVELFRAFGDRRAAIAPDSGSASPSVEKRWPQMAARSAR